MGLGITLKYRHDSSCVNKVPPGYLKLIFWVRPVDGSPYLVDLTPFCDPPVAYDAPPSGKRSSTLFGRGQYARGFAQVLCGDRSPYTTYMSKRQSLRTFLKFLEDVGPEWQHDFPELITDDMGWLLQTWLEERKWGGYYKNIRIVVAQIRAATHFLYDEEMVPLVWPPSGTQALGTQKDFTNEATKALHRALVKEAREIKAMFREGNRLLSEGRDPRLEGRALVQEGWEAPANHAWLANAILSDPDMYDVMRRTVFRGVCAPGYQVPGTGDVAGDRLASKLRWFTFGRRDAAVFLWIFLLKTGWNVSTAFALDVRSEKKWCRVDHLSPSHWILRAPKARAGGKLQYVTSLEEPEWHPYQIVRFMIERTEPLREILRSQLAAALLRTATDRSTALEQHVVEIRANLKSPWLYVNARGGIARLRPRDGATINEVARLVDSKELERKREAIRLAAEDVDRDEEDAPEEPMPVDPEPVKWVASDARDAWIRHAYEASDFDTAVLQATTQHANLGTSKHYIGAASLDASAERQLRSMHSTIFADLEDKRPLDLVRLKILVSRGTITEDQERRLADVRMRTKVGMGCIDHEHPPKKVAPGHRAGEPCVVQRCACCPHRVVFEDSLPAMARRVVELRLIQLNMPHESWIGSSVKVEVEAIEAMLNDFDPGDVQVAMATWRTKFERGDAVIHDTFPSY